MKSMFLFIMIAFATCGFGQAVAPETSGNFKKLGWLVGTWTGTNNTKPGRLSHERWEKVAEHELRGYGVTMQGQDTVLVEKTTILVKGNSIYYVADVPENEQPVYFKLTEITHEGFVCENLEHDFPKKITYQLNGANLKAQISGDGKSFNYLFQKQ